MCVDGSMRARRVVKCSEEPGGPERLYTSPVLSPRPVSENLLKFCSVFGFLDLRGLKQLLQPDFSPINVSDGFYANSVITAQIVQTWIGGAAQTAQMFLASYSGSC